MGIFNNIGRYSDIREYIKNFKEQTQSGLKLDANNNYDIEGKRLANVGQGVDDYDAVVMRQFATHDSILTAKVAQLKADSLQVDGSSHMTGDLDLRGQKLINPGEIEMNRKLITNLDTDEDNDLSAVNMITLKKFHPDVPAHTHEVTKDIDLKELFNVIQSKQRSLNELKTHYDSLVSFEEVNENFLSRQEEFPMETQLNMNHNSITNLKDPEFGGEAATKSYADKKLDLAGGTMTGDLDMGLNRIKNLKTPVSSSDAANAAFVTNFMKGNYLNLNGGTMTGDINMGNHKITNLPSPASNSNPATKKYVDDTDTRLRSAFTGELAKKISIGEIDQNNKKIINLGEPTLPKDAATKEFVERSHLSQSGAQKNMFPYLMANVNESSSESNIVVNGIKRFTRSPHSIFKNAYKFTMGKDVRNRYASRLGFNFFRLPAGAYTFAVEFYPPTQTSVSVDCRSTAINVNNQFSKRFPTSGNPVYIKHIVQLHKWKISAPEYLMVDIKCEGYANSPANGEGWMIVYGIAGTHNDVPSFVLDRPYVIDNGTLMFEVKVDMNDQILRHIGDPMFSYDAATKGYVDNTWYTSLLFNPAYIDNFIKEKAECLYSVERGKTNEVRITLTRDISHLYDQSLSGNDATQSTVAYRPKLSTAKNAKRYFINFDGSNRRITSGVNLNSVSGFRVINIIHVFIVFRLATHLGTDRYFRNGLFGNDDGGWDKFVCFAANTNNLIISGTEKDGSEYQDGYNVQVKSSDWLYKANASDLGKWCCLSVHWDISGGAGRSSCWVNGKKLKIFEARAITGATKMTIGDVNGNGNVSFNGDIQMFLMYNGFDMDNQFIRAHHKMICERYKIDHDVISI